MTGQNQALNNKTVLFISLSCVGDAVMTTPVLQALHEYWPNAVIDIVADRRSVDVFQHCPYRGQIYYKDKQKFLRGAPALLRELYRKRYDLVVDLRTDGLAWLLRSEKSLTKFRAVSYGAHAIESMMGVIRPIHGDRSIPATHIWLDADSMAQSADTLAGLPANSLLAIGPGCGGKKAEKFWPTAHYAKLANSLRDTFSGVILLGAGRDVALAAEIREQLTLPCVDACDRTSLLEAAALIKKARLFIGSDSGLGHVAAAVGTPSLTFFSVDDPERCRPWGPAAACLVGEDRDARNIGVGEAETRVREIVAG